MSIEHSVQTNVSHYSVQCYECCK